MPKAFCPVCEAELRLSGSEATLGSRITCPDCGAALEVVEEDPLELEEIYMEGEEGIL